jgi:sugar O-acyltransferase (sialic acid O-acetyltransferase NeuD family)
MSETPVPIVILGAGGDALVVAESIVQAEASGSPIRFAGFLDDKLAGQSLYGRDVIGGLDAWSRLDSAVRFIPAIQKVKDSQRRAHRLDTIGIPPERWITVVHPRAAVSSDAQIGHGAFIASCATVQPGCRIGSFASIRAGGVLGHDCVIEDHTYVGPNAVMCGRCRLERGAHLGPGAVLLDGMTMGAFSVAGIAAAVTKTVAVRTIVFGNPARRVGRVRDEAL